MEFDINISHTNDQRGSMQHCTNAIPVRAKQMNGQFEMEKLEGTELTSARYLPRLFGKIPPTASSMQSHWDLRWSVDIMQVQFLGLNIYMSNPRQRVSSNISPHDRYGCWTIVTDKAVFDRSSRFSWNNACAKSLRLFPHKFGPYRWECYTHTV